MQGLGIHPTAGAHLDANRSVERIYELWDAALGAKDVEAAAAGITDEATFKQFAPAVFKNCGSCHELYKAKSG